MIKPTLYWGWLVSRLELPTPPRCASLCARRFHAIHFRPTLDVAHSMAGMRTLRRSPPPAADECSACFRLDVPPSDVVSRLGRAIALICGRREPR
jgi:hypothetical protein